MDYSATKQLIDDIKTLCGSYRPLTLLSTEEELRQDLRLFMSKTPDLFKAFDWLDAQKTRIMSQRKQAFEYIGAQRFESDHDKEKIMSMFLNGYLPHRKTLEKYMPDLRLAGKPLGSQNQLKFLELLRNELTALRADMLEQKLDRIR